MSEKGLYPFGALNSTVSITYRIRCVTHQYVSVRTRYVSSVLKAAALIILMQKNAVPVWLAVATFVTFNICVFPSPALAQGAETSAAAEPTQRRRSSLIEEVIVTAQKREESISDVPIAMQAFTGDTMRKLGVVDTTDIATLVPAFSYADSGRDTPIYTMRGIGFNDVSRSASSTVGVYIDEVPFPYPYMTQGANVDIERIEVLKGPQGTLYGRNTTGGAINYIANKPTDSLEFGVEAEYGRFEHYSVEGYLSGPITDSLRGRIALRHIESDEGWQISLTRPDDRLGKKDKQAGRGILEWTPIDTLRLDLTLDWWRDDSEPQAPQPIDINPQNPSVSEDMLNPAVRNHPVVTSEDNRRADWVPDIPWTLDNEFVMPALRAYWDVTETTAVTLIAAYSDFKTGHARIPVSGLSVRSAEVIQKTTDAKAYSVELRADGSLFDERLNWLLGVYTSEDTVEDFTRQAINTNSAVFNIQPGVTPLSNTSDFGGEQDAESDAVFTNADYALTDYLELSLGLRYTEEKRELAGCSLEHPQADENPGTGFAPIFNARSLSEGGSNGAGPGTCLTLHEETRDPTLIRKELKEDNLGGKAAISWRPTADHLFYTSFSRGFKSGSFPIIPASEGEQFDPVTQERVDAIELGGKTGWFDNALKVNFAVYDYEYQDKQQLSYFVDPTFGPIPKLFNIPETTVRGAELEIQSSPLPGLFLSVAASYLETEIQDFVGITKEGETVDFSGHEVPFAPNKEVTVLANYSFPIPLLDNLEGTVGADYSYVGETTSGIENTPILEIPSYGLVNARAGISDVDGHWDVTVWVRNVTNEFYQLNLPQNAADSVVRFTGMPQTAGITFSYRYF